MSGGDQGFRLMLLHSFLQMGVIAHTQAIAQMGMWV